MNIKFLFTLLFLVAAASLGSATGELAAPKVPDLPAGIPNENPIELLSKLSAECQGALFSIVANPEFFQCVPVVALLPLVTDPDLLPSVMKDPLKNGAKLLPFVEAVCAVPKCSDEGVANAKKAVEEGCSKDLNNPLIPLVLGVLEFYSPVRDIICFEDNKDTLCIVDLATTVFTLPPPPPKDFKLLGSPIDNLLAAEPKFICTPCNKAILNTAKNFFEEDPHALQVLESLTNIGPLEVTLVEAYFVVKCGFQFVDGKIPDSTIDPKKFTYQLKGESSDARRNTAGLVVMTSLLAAGSLI